VELKPGYKHTEVGVIPEDWKVELLGQHATFRTGPFGSALHKSDYVSDGVPVINPMHIVDGYIEPTDDMTISESVAESLSQFRLCENEIVIGRRGDMGRCAVVQSHQSGWLCGTGSMIVRSTDFNPKFLQRVLSSKRVIAAIVSNSVGTTMVNLNQGSLSSLRIQYPALPEQSAIATALSDMDALLAAQDALIAKQRAIKQGAMQELLTGKRRLPGFDGKSEVRKLGEVARIRNQKTGTHQVASDTLCVELENVGQGTGCLESRSVAGDSVSMKYTFQVGDVLFGRLRSYLRKYWIATEPGLCSTEIWPLATDGRIVPDYLFAIVQTDSFIESANISFGTHMPRADWGVVRNFEIYLPSVEEQAAIAEVLSDIDAELTVLEAKREKTSLLKQGMMQELLTGKTRLI
jgi:type I restriction enzyme S subunit